MFFSSGWLDCRLALTGPMSTTGVNSRTFSIGAIEGFTWGESNRVILLAILSCLLSSIKRSCS